MISRSEGKKRRRSSRSSWKLEDESMIEKGGDLFYDLMLSPRYYGYFGHLSSKLVNFLASHFIKPKPVRSMATEAVLLSGSKVTWFLKKIYNRCRATLRLKAGSLKGSEYHGWQPSDQFRKNKDKHKCNQL